MGKHKKEKMTPEAVRRFIHHWGRNDERTQRAITAAQMHFPNDPLWEELGMSTGSNSAGSGGGSSSSGGQSGGGSGGSSGGGGGGSKN
ncbi:hypothetical protein JMJ77_0012744 [Colletotrichum scovillei]|uniref:Uncharacterized protein n=1 Tax=Colletotrichum scovillei TaxID=1209932 RepID=A0A9P7R669_9PEZI|nr:hypothetical protein JMJ77_0012744 [Colletotrichum scovillei]KAG7069026.1 hypothetical protein JMJ76_0002704 [Colletotrichum scovillei]KAG7072979.1 hypothetical protein JMJ78_0013962 [Colletotrichum scovillei]